MKPFLRFGVPFCFLLFSFLFSTAQTTNTYSSSTTWTVPSGVSNIVIRVYGGGAGKGGEDCGAGCGNPVAGPVGYVYVSYPVVPGDVIGIYPGGKGTDGADNVSGDGGGAAGVSSYNVAYNGGAGGNAGPSGSSGGGGGGGAATIVTVNSVIKIIAGGAGGGGGMANMAGSGLPGSVNIMPNGIFTTGGDGLSSSGDGGGSGAGGGGFIGSLGGNLLPAGGETAGEGGYRGSNNITGATSVFLNGSTTWANAGKVEISYGGATAGGTTSANQMICSGTQPQLLSASGFYGTTLQWQYSDDNSNWNDVSGANDAELSSVQMGSLTANRYYRVQIDGTANSTTTIITIYSGSGSSAMPTGSGTSMDPHLINSLAHLQWIVEDDSRWNKHYKQTADIDASVTSLSCFNSGNGWVPIGNGSVQFTGTYDGDGHRISNLYIDQTGYTYAGFFGHCSNSSITNLLLENVTVIGSAHVGAIAGYADGICTFSKVGSTGSVTGTGYDGINIEISVGGIVGRLNGNTGTVIEQSFSTVAINNMGDANTHNTGGLVGYIENTEVNNSYFKGSVTDNTFSTILYAGGIAGYSNGCSYSKVYASTNIDAWAMFVEEINIIYGSYTSDPVNNSFYNYDRNYYNDYTGGSGLGEADMQRFPNFYNAGWDMHCETDNGSANIWGMNTSDNDQFPFLAWQGYSAGCPQWIGQTDNTFEECTNWANCFVPVEGMDIIISPVAVEDLILPQNWIAGSLVFNAAGKKVQLNNYNLTITGTINGADAGNYIQTNGTGVLKTTVANGATFNFTTGNSAYNPVSIINNSGASDDFTVNVVDAVYANASNGAVVSNNHVQRTWYIGKTNANGGSGISFIFNWNNGEENTPLATKALYHYGSSWDKQTGTTSSTSTSLTYTGYTGSFSPFSVMEGSATLPVSWLNFTAQKQTKNVLLKWSTATEQNTDRFIVQHSTDAVNWNNIGTVTGAGNSSSIQNYQHIHSNAINGLNYYRIHQRDLDGKQSFSKVVSVQFTDAVALFSVYPNPVVNGQLNIRLTQSANIRVYNMLGVSVLQTTLQPGTHILQLNHLPKALYRLQVNDEWTSVIVQ
jgi:hypothetical protein